MSKRIEQINALLQQIIAEIFIENIEFEPGILATITRVDTAADLGHAKIFVSVLPLAKKKEALDKIRKSIFEIQKIVFSKLKIAHVPRLHFFTDETEEEAQRIEELLDQIKEEDKV
ncbi:30S ribosome-binding factor RbfA [Patescibacteria group bacterium]|nr:MAG: 30S ribosome-binding factor RbfA [Patescibacteria group bacterium]